MHSPALFEALAKSVRVHEERGDATPTQVVRVVLLDPDLDPEGGEDVGAFLEGVAAYLTEGRTADAAHAATDIAVGETDPELRGAVLEAADIPTRPGAPLELRIDADGVSLSGTESGSLSPGEHELVGLAGAILGRDWQDAKFGLLTYSEQSMDVWVKRAAWDGVSVALDDKQIGMLRTLFVVIRAPRLEYTLHCRDEFGADWVADGSRLVRRGPPETARQHGSEIARSSTKPTVLYLGAGFSVSSDLPSGNELRDRALREYFSAGEDAPIEPLARRLFQGAQQAGKLDDSPLDEDSFVESLTLEDVIALVTELTTDPSPTLAFFSNRHAEVQPGTAINELASVVGRIAGLVIVTVNFDELIEQAARVERLRVFVTPEEFGEFPGYLEHYLAGQETQVPLLKLHGTISAPESCVVSAVITGGGLATEKAEALRCLARSVPDTGQRPHWVYIGTSLRDKDIVPVLLEPIFARAFEESWVMPLRPSGVEKFGGPRALQWQIAGPRALTVDARTYSVSADAFARFVNEATAADP